MAPKEVVLGFWTAMQSNDFVKASEWLTEDYQGQWPQSNELIVGRANFIAINSAYPADGVWTFKINSMVCEGDTVVTDVSVSDGVRFDRAITFHTVKEGLICCQREFWPESYPAPEWRKEWVKPLNG